MRSLIGISLWIALATIVPGLITIGALYCSITIINPGIWDNISIHRSNEWVMTGIALAIMILTQGLGILFEEFMVKFKLYGKKVYKANIPKGIDPANHETCELNKYDEYKGLYLLLAELNESDDSKGHLERITAQFFLTNNTLVSFIIGLVFSIVLIISCNTIITNYEIAYILFLIFCITILYLVGIIRFKVMAKVLWALRRKKHKTPIGIKIK